MEILFYQLTAVLIYMNLWFAAAAIAKRNDLADVVWGPGFLMLAVLGWAYNPNPAASLVLLAVGLWAARLSWHIGQRFFSKKQEDFRYKKWRRDWGKRWLVYSWLKIFFLQGALMLVVSVSFWPAFYDYAGNIGIINVFGLLLFLFGFLFETVADWQLKRFKSGRENQGRILRSGLWRYSRHPNYFGEAVLWWGIWLITFGSPYFFLGLIGPLAISFLVLKVSGIPLLEKKYQGNPEFEEYKKQTNAFFPGLPKKA